MGTWPIHQVWSEEEDEAVEQMAADGATGSEIAISLYEMFGVKRTRSAVMGRLKRLGVRLSTPAFGGKGLPPGDRLRPPRPKVERKAPPKAPKPRPEPKVERPLLPIIAAVVEPLPPPPPPPPPPLVEVEPKHFLDIRDGECRWPLWSSRCAFEHKIMCAAPTMEKQSYCPKCFKLSRRDPSPSERIPGEKTRRAA